MRVARGDKLTQKDIMIWVMKQQSGIRTYYLIEKEPFERAGIKNAVHRVGTTGDAVFRYRDQAEAELAKFPPGDEQ